MYSLMSILIMAFSSSNKNSASARDSSVLPTPVGPRKINEPIGRFGSCKPARARRTALEFTSLGQFTAPCCTLQLGAKPIEFFFPFPLFFDDRFLFLPFGLQRA